MLSAIWRTCFFECVRAFRGLGLSAPGETHFICLILSSFQAQADGRAEASRPKRLLVQFFAELRPDLVS
jgi:hypothetical protein